MVKESSLTKGTEFRLKYFSDIINTLTPATVVDLGAGHCKFSEVLHARGWEVTAVDARSERVPFGIPFRFIQSDIRTFDVSDYSLVLALGVFYHLTLEDQIQVLKNWKGKPVILDTHTSEVPLTVQGKYEGSFYNEPGELTSSWGNPTSFWHTPESLFKLLNNHGFSVEKVSPTYASNRAFYLLGELK